jgi:PAS domain S-box-containing protein
LPLYESAHSISTRTQNQGDCITRMSLRTVDYSLKEIESLYQSLLETMPAIIYLTEAESPFAPIFINDRVRILGYTVAEWMSRPDFWQTLLHPGDKDWVLQNYEALRAGQGTIHLEYRVYGKNGKVFWVRETGKYVLGKDGKPICRQGTLIDITEKKIAESEREELVAKLHTALAEIKTLNGLIPVCTCCSKVRTDQNYWQDLEKYMRERLTSKFSTSICPDCIQNVKSRLNGITQKLQTGGELPAGENHV